MSKAIAHFVEGRLTALAFAALFLACGALAVFTLLGAPQSHAMSAPSDAHVDPAVAVGQAEAQVARMVDDRLVIHLKELRKMTSVLAQVSR
jgi:hypothetical protein